MEDIGGGGKGGGGGVAELDMELFQHEEMEYSHQKLMEKAAVRPVDAEASSSTLDTYLKGDQEETTGGSPSAADPESLQEQEKIFLGQKNEGGGENFRDVIIQEADDTLDCGNDSSAKTAPVFDMPGIELQPQTDIKSPTKDKPLVVPLSSFNISSLEQVIDEANPILPTVPPHADAALEANNNTEHVNGHSLSKPLASTKSLPFALSKSTPCTSVGILEEKCSQGTKRKLHGGCSNAKCTSNSDNLVIARKSAMLFFSFNTSYKKVYKICKACNEEAENFLKNTVNALMTEQNVFAFKPKPQGVAGDNEVMEVDVDEVEDDPQDVQIMEAEDREVVEFGEDLNNLVGSLLSNLNLKSQLQKCEETAVFESAILERDFLRLENQISFVQEQVTEIEKAYNVMAQHYAPVPVITEEIDISADGVVVASRAENEHLQKIPNLPTLPPDIYRPNSESFDGVSHQSPQRRAKENGPHYDEDVDMIEIESVSTPVRRPQCPLVGPPKEIPRVFPTVGTIVYAQHYTLLQFWIKAQIEEVVNVGAGKSPEFIVRFEKRKGLPRVPVKQVTAKQIAHNIPCPFILIVGTRIIAKFREELKTDPIRDDQYYAGLVAEPPHVQNGFRYLIFFDDGYAQYVDYRDVLLVCEFSKEVWSDVHPDSSEFMKNYINKYPERPMAHLSIGQIVSTEWNGAWWVARVVELDCSLVKMKFENDGRLEWIYRGSTRLAPIYEEQMHLRKRKTARKMIRTAINGKNQIGFEYNNDKERMPSLPSEDNKKPTARKSTSGAQRTPENPYADFQPRRLVKPDYGEFEGTIMKRPVPATATKQKEYVDHLCDAACVNYYDESNDEYKKMSPLAIPLHLGFSREIIKNPRRSVYYRGPCGEGIRDLEELYGYLTQTVCEIPIDHFCFDLAIDCLNEFRPTRQISFIQDLAYGRENIPIQVVNAFDYSVPPYVEYVSHRIAGAGVSLNTDDEFLVGCECEDDCRDKSKCRCWQMTLSGISFTKLNNPDYPNRGYEYRRLRESIVSGIYECNPKCKCSKTCCNRVVQNGLKFPLQVFKTAAKGWGIRALFDIPEGAFICIYAGQILTEAGANADGMEFGDEYLAELNFIESIEDVKNEYESDVTDIETENPGECSTKRKARKKKGRSDDYDMEVQSCVSRYRDPKPSTSKELRVNTMGKKNDSESSKSSDRNEEGDIGVRRRLKTDSKLKTDACKPKVIVRRPLREYFGEENECFIMDAKTTGNIGRYFNHSCEPNVFVQNVFVDTHDLRFPWIAFFASKHIQAGSELTWDYNYEIGSVPNKVLYCYCGSPECRARLL